MKKAEIFQRTLMEKLEKFLPMKTEKNSSDDQPWYSTKLKKFERKMKREYFKHKSQKSGKK